jgi:hypothetical protein
MRGGPGNFGEAVAHHNIVDDRNALDLEFCLSVMLHLVSQVLKLSILGE